MDAIGIRTEWDTRDIQRLADRLGDKRRNRAMSVAINTSARSVRGKARSRVAKAMGLRAKDVDKSFKVAPFAKPGSLFADVVGTGRPLPLIRFNAKQTAKGVKAKAWGVSKLYPGLFIATMASGHRGVFRRLGKKRLPIKETYGPGVAAVMADAANLEEIKSEASQVLHTNVVRQLKRYAFAATR